MFLENTNKLTLSELISCPQHKLHKLIRFCASYSLWPWFAVCISLCITFFFWRPDYRLWGDLLTSPYGNALKWWLENPFSKVPVECFFDAKDLVDGGHYYGCASHCDKLTFRAFIPYLHTIFPFGLWTLLISSHLAGIFIFKLTYQYLFNETHDPVCATLGIWSLAATYAGGWAFHDFYFGDAIAVALLLAALIQRNAFLCGILIFFAMITDERAFIAAPFVAVSQFLKEAYYTKSYRHIILRLIQSSALKSLSMAVGVYILLRGYFVFFKQINIGSTMFCDIDIIRHRIYTDYPYKIFTVFELLWILPIIFLLYQFHQKKIFTMATLFYMCSCFGIIGVSFLVWDLERSLFYLLPAIIVPIVCLNVNSLRTLLGVCFVGNVLLFEPGHSLLVFIGATISTLVR